MGPKVAVVVYPGPNSEDETLRALRAAGLDGAELVHWSRGPAALDAFDAFVLPGGFASEERVRAGAVAAHDALTDGIIAAAERGRFVLGICNGAQILLETGLVPGRGPVRRPTAAFAPNAEGRFRAIHVHVRATRPLPILAGLDLAVAIPAWAAHGDGRLVAAPAELDRLHADGHVAFIYADAAGAPIPAHNGSALDCAGLANRVGNVLALMPHPERDAWAYMHLDREPTREDVRVPSGGSAFFTAFAAAVRGVGAVR